MILVLIRHLNRDRKIDSDHNLTRKVSQVIPGGQQEGEHGAVHQVQREHCIVDYESGSRFYSIRAQGLFLINRTGDPYIPADYSKFTLCQSASAQYARVKLFLLIFLENFILKCTFDMTECLSSSSLSAQPKSNSCHVLN